MTLEVIINEYAIHIPVLSPWNIPSMCLEMRNTPNYSHLAVKLMIRHWALEVPHGATIFRQTLENTMAIEGNE